MRVQVFSDVVCPWCYIGKRRFERALDHYTRDHPDETVDVSYRAFMLDPTAPTGVSTPVRDAYARKFGGPVAADAIIERVTAEAAREDLVFDLDRAQRSNTGAAHRLLVLAQHRGVQLELKERLLAAYFTQGLAIGERDVLVTLGADAGLDPDECRHWLDGDGGRREVVEDLEWARDNGITSVPTFVFDERLAIPGAQESELFVRVLERARRA